MLYAKPKSLDEALALLAADQWRLLAGGTDFYPAQGVRPIDDNILDLNGIASLRWIDRTASHIVFGARTTWQDICRADLPPAFDALKLAAREVGSVQIQNTGTIAGNLCNASPAADGMPPLLVLDAEVEVRSAAGARYLPLDAFVLGNRRTALAPGEMVTAIRVPVTSTQGRSTFLKLGARRYLVISIAMVAARFVLNDDQRIEHAAISVGACSPVAVRLRGLEQQVIGQSATTGLSAAIEAYDFDELSPIDDVRATAGYRRDAVRELIRRASAEALAHQPADEREGVPA
jgi:CO/xanthine dehydrogenase FAD-binding subunit